MVFMDFPIDKLSDEELRYCNELSRMIGFCLSRNKCIDGYKGRLIGFLSALVSCDVLTNDDFYLLLSYFLHENPVLFDKYSR